MIDLFIYSAVSISSIVINTFTSIRLRTKFQTLGKGSDGEVLRDETRLSSIQVSGEVSCIVILLQGGAFGGSSEAMKIIEIGTLLYGGSQSGFAIEIKEITNLGFLIKVEGSTLFWSIGGTLLQTFTWSFARSFDNMKGAIAFWENRIQSFDGSK